MNNNRNIKRILLFAIGALLVGAMALFYLPDLLVKTPGDFHYYQSPMVRIGGIKLEVIYFVPNDQAPDQQFYEKIKQAMAQVQSFHMREFNGLNPLRYFIYPNPVVGEESSAFYDSDGTARGNPGAIKKIMAETGQRLYNRESELYDERFAKRKSNELPVRVFVYQGVGASSGVLSVLMAYDYLKQTAYGPTIIYHELMHVLGVPDAYDYDTGSAQSDDIMGGGREKPILETYLRDEIKKMLTQ